MKNYKTLLKWLTFSILIGAVGGTIGSGFSRLITLATSLRQNNAWLLYLLPLGGFLTVYICKKLKTSSLGTNQVLLSLNKGQAVSPKITISVFASTILTHLLGGSAGKEGAALQIGGGISSFLCRFFKIEREKQPIATICSMAALFSALFGTPLGAAVFCNEVFFKRKSNIIAVPFSLVSSYTAFLISRVFHAHHESFSYAMPYISFELIWKTAIVVICSSAVCGVWVYALDIFKKYFKLFMRNEYLRITVGAVLIIALTLILNTREYNGGGMEVVSLIFTNNRVRYEAFILKILFTCITVAAGFKGGEIVPTFFIGATYGAALGLILGINLPFAAVIGMVVLFSGSTNCPLATVFIAVELFGFKGIIFYILAALIARILTGKKRLYNI